MPQQPIRAAAVAGSWYPGAAHALRRAVAGYLDAVPPLVRGDVRALIAPHAGLVYSGPIGAHAYAAVAGRHFDAAILIGPSHYAAFDGIAVYARGAFETPFGAVPVAEAEAEALQSASALVRPLERVHEREHSLEMQLPFLAHVLPGTPIVPLVMGEQTRATIDGLAEALAVALKGRRPLLVASSDLSHYYDADTAARLDSRIVDLVERFDPDGLLDALEQFPAHACGGGPMAAVMKAARALGARDARVLVRGDSGDVSGDKSAVVGYLSAVFGLLEHPARGSAEEAP